MVNSGVQYLTQHSQVQRFQNSKNDCRRPSLVDSSCYLPRPAGWRKSPTVVGGGGGGRLHGGSKMWMLTLGDVGNHVESTTAPFVLLGPARRLDRRRVCSVAKIQSPISPCAGVSGEISQRGISGLGRAFLRHSTRPLTAAPHREQCAPTPAP